METLFVFQRGKTTEQEGPVLLSVPRPSLPPKKHSAPCISQLWLPQQIPQMGGLVVEVDSLTVLGLEV